MFVKQDVVLCLDKRFAFCTNKSLTTRYHCFPQFYTQQIQSLEPFGHNSKAEFEVQLVYLHINSLHEAQDEL